MTRVGFAFIVSLFTSFSSTVSFQPFIEKFGARPIRALHCRQYVPLCASNYRLRTTPRTAPLEQILFAAIGRSDESVPIMLVESDLQEKFVRSTGNGGQKVNKSSSKVDLVHIPTGLKVSCQEARDLSTNRQRARSLMLAKLDLHINGKCSKIEKKRDLVRKRKKDASRKARKKYGAGITTEQSEALSDPLGPVGV